MAAKYNLGEKVWFLSIFGVESSKITGIVSELFTDYAPGFTDIQPGTPIEVEAHCYLFNFNKPYSLSPRIAESKIFKTKEELIASL